MSSIEKHHKKGGSKLEGGEGEKVIYILSVFSGEKSEIAKTINVLYGCWSSEGSLYIVAKLCDIF